MTGLEKIVQQIQDEARKAADEAIAKAKAEAEEIAAKAQKEAQVQAAALKAQAENAVANQLEAAKSAAALAKRRAVLSAKQEIIGEIIEEAEHSIYSLPDDKYFDLILKMVEKYSLTQDGDILFSTKDLSRLPNGFAEKGSKAAKGGLAISKETRPIRGGFVLAYGGIEENCSVEALFYAARERLQDKVQELLFS